MPFAPGPSRRRLAAALGLATLALTVLAACGGGPPAYARAGGVAVFAAVLLASLLVAALLRRRRRPARSLDRVLLARTVKRAKEP